MDDFDPAKYRPRENDDDMPRFDNLVWRVSALLREGKAETQQLEGLTALIRGSDVLRRAVRYQVPELKAAEVCQFAVRTAHHCWRCCKHHIGS